MVIMGIDPGTATTGWGVVEKQKQTFTCVAAGAILTDKKLALPERLHIIHDDLTQLIKQFSPEAVVVEELFFNANTTTALSVGQARGVILLTAQMAHCAIFSYTPLQVKMAITGYGRAQKPQIQEMVKKILKLSSIPKPDDAADALAIALTYGFAHTSLVRFGTP